jgi:hypothetical protein
MEKLVSRQIYAILIRKRAHTPTSQLYYIAKFPSFENNWLKIYSLPRRITKNAYDRVFQYKILNNVLYLNKKLFLFGKSDTSLCSFCENAEEDMTHLFSACPRILALWIRLQTAIAPNIILRDLNAEFALVGFYEAPREHFNLVNHILLLFKLYIYQSRNSKTISLIGMIGKISEIAKLECSLAAPGSASFAFYENKWRPIGHLLPNH